MDELLAVRSQLVGELRDIWEENNLTALISPFWPGATPRKQDIGDCALMAEYSLIWNLLQNPAGVIPVTTVLESEQHYTDSFNDSYTKVINNMNRDSAGLPISV